jgi:hypothetical protein
MNGYVRMKNFVCRATLVPFRRCLKDMCGDNFMQRLSAALHGTYLGFYLRYALQEGSADVVACLPVPRA